VFGEGASPQSPVRSSGTLISQLSLKHWSFHLLLRHRGSGLSLPLLTAVLQHNAPLCGAEQGNTGPQWLASCTDCEVWCRNRTRNRSLSLDVTASGVTLRPLGASPTIWPLVPTGTRDDYDCEAVGGMSGRGNSGTRRKPIPVPICPPQFPYDLSRARTRALAADSQ
jgi:hypothetical protein